MNVPLEFLLKVFIVLHHSLLFDASIINRDDEEGLFMWVVEDELINLVCKSPGIPVAYCGFKHPTGARYSYVVQDSVTYRCNKRLRVTKSDVGKWQCYMGLKPLGQEMSRDIDIKIVGKLAAIKETVYAIVGQETTLTCVYTEGAVRLRYCRFERPHGNPLNIRETFRKQNKIQGKYYLPYNARIDNGECSVTINQVSYEDEGIWTCVAGINNNIYSVQISVIVESGFWKVTIITLIAVTAVCGALGALILYVRHIPKSVVDASCCGTGETVAMVDRVSRRSHGNEENIRRL